MRGDPLFCTADGRLRVLPVRAGLILLELPDLSATLALFDALQEDPIAGVRELVPAACTVLVAFDPLYTDVAEVVSAVLARRGRSRPQTKTDMVEIPVRYDGPDLGEVAEHLGMSVADLIARHAACLYTVAFTGFAPGFAYLAGDDPVLRVPRRASPRPHVAAGAVGLAGEFSGVYPKDSPGGWQLIGSTPVEMFDLRRTPAALLQPGQRVRFRDLAKGAFHSVSRPLTDPIDVNGPKGDTVPTEGLAILSTALPLLMQDGGRPGQARQGISVSGAADRASLHLVNRLLGNDDAAPALEVSPGVTRLTVLIAGVMAITGAEVGVCAEDNEGKPVRAGLNGAFAVEAGDQITLSPPKRGCRAYVGWRGGFAVTPVLGSASFDTLAHVGPPPIRTGDRVGVLSHSGGGCVQQPSPSAFDMPETAETVFLDVVCGPRADWFATDALDRFLGQAWTVTPTSNRVGLRLTGQPLERKEQAELPSEATVRGAIQVPTGGQPVLFLSDHPLTGGYPVIANVVARHLDLAGQIPIGARIRFNAVADGLAALKESDLSSPTPETEERP